LSPQRHTVTGLAGTSPRPVESVQLMSDQPRITVVGSTTTRSRPHTGPPPAGEVEQLRDERGGVAYRGSGFGPVAVTRR